MADVGTVIHPHSLGGQILGGGIQGIGHVRSQKLVYDPHYGNGLATRMHHNKPPTILDIPLKAQWAAVGIAGSDQSDRRQGHRRAVDGRRRPARC